MSKLNWLDELFAPEIDAERCHRKRDENEWWCFNDHTGCLWNDGNNTCSHPGWSRHPLEENDKEENQ